MREEADKKKRWMTILSFLLGILALWGILMLVYWLKG